MIAVANEFKVNPGVPLRDLAVLHVAGHHRVEAVVVDHLRDVVGHVVLGGHQCDDHRQDVRVRQDVLLGGLVRRDDVRLNGLHLANPRLVVVDDTRVHRRLHLHQAKRCV